MEKLFGVEVAAIARVLSVMLALVFIGLALLAWKRPVFFKLGIRPIPRRRAQSLLIVTGLMLATLIITAAFVTGDTLSHSIRLIAISGLGEIDETITVSQGSTGSRYFKMDRYEKLAEQVSGYELIDRIVPGITESTPVVNLTQQQSLRSLNIIAMRPEDASVLPGEELVDAAGQTLALEDLGANEVYLNAKAAENLNAMPGDRLEIYARAHPKNFVVRAVSAMGEEARMVMRLDQAQRLFNQFDEINLIVVSNQGDVLGGVVHSQAVTAHLRGLLSDPRIAAQIFSILARDSSVSQALRVKAEDMEGNTKTDILALADGLDSGVLSAETRSLLADESRAATVQGILADADWGSDSLRDRLAKMFGDLSELAVQNSKRDTLDEGDLAASVFTTVFIVSGLFGITAGLVLIFLIFVMLAAERKPEMGITRAVGGQRSHLVEMFTFEGTAYDLGAAVAGVAVGIAVGLISAFTMGQAFAGLGLPIKPYVSLKSIAVSFSLGVLVTFATVLLSANRVSRLNIVSAIRDLPEPPQPPTFMRDRLLAPFRDFINGFKALFRLKIAKALRTWFVDFQVSLMRLIWLGYITGPLTLLLGLQLIPIGIQMASGAFYYSGVSFVIIGTGLVLRLLLTPLARRLTRGRDWDAAAFVDRVMFTLIGAALTVYWSLPTQVSQDLLGTPADIGGGAEMLFIAGVMMVGGAVLVIMYNTDLLLRLILSVVGGSPKAAPVLRMAVAYPLSSRFRTGMTIAIFAVVTFSVIFMTTIFKINDYVLGDTEELTGGFDLRVNYSSLNPVNNFPRAVRSNPNLQRSDFAVIGSMVNMGVEIRQDQSDPWSMYYVQAADAEYLENTYTEIGVMAEGYLSSEEIWETVRTKPGYAVIDRLVVPSKLTTTYTVGGPGFRLEGVYLEDESMKPIKVEIRDLNTGTIFDMTIIGVLAQSTMTGYGLYTSQDSLAKGFDIELPAPTYYIRLAEGVDPAATSSALQSAYLRNGLQSADMAKELRDANAIQYVFQQLMLAFLTIGLVVGVAALGVISTRAVVERRQQIGMLRALGFQREMVSWIFIIESSFVSLLGIGLGCVLALIPASQVVEDMKTDLPGITFTIPWTEILLVAGLAYAMTLLTTWLPATQASKVTPAEALRYE